MTIEGGTRLARKSFNTSPTDQISIIGLIDEQRVLKPAQWGFIPKWWSKPLKDGSAFNTRTERLRDARSMFSDAFIKRRCIIPASGFYKWTGEKIMAHSAPGAVRL
jgi:putative SOS response-associated peptidase YedK